MINLFPRMLVNIPLHQSVISHLYLISMDFTLSSSSILRLEETLDIKVCQFGSTLIGGIDISSLVEAIEFSPYF